MSHLAIAQYLVQQGADKDKASNDGATPLFTASADGHLSVVQYLVQQGADKNKAADSATARDTPLEVARAMRRTAVVKNLREQGAL